MRVAMRSSVAIAHFGCHTGLQGMRVNVDAAEIAVYPSVALTGICFWLCWDLASEVRRLDCVPWDMSL